MLEFFPYPFLAGLGALLLALMAARLRRSSPARLVTWALCGLYLLALAGVTLFPLPLSALEGRQPGAWQDILGRVNFIPFLYLKYANPGNARFALLEITQNLLLSLPFGFGVSFLGRVGWAKAAWLALGLGLVIESTQLLVSLALGAAYRTVDITDVLLNAAGAWLGYALYRTAAWFIRRARPERP